MHTGSTAARERQLADALAENVRLHSYREGLVVINRRMEAEIERLRAALKPFVKARQSIEVGDLSGALSVITVGDLRRAAMAFGDEQKADGK